MTKLLCRAVDCKATSVVSGGYCQACGIQINGAPYFPQPRCDCGRFLETARQYKRGLCARCEGYQQHSYANRGCVLL